MFRLIPALAAALLAAGALNPAPAAADAAAQVRALVAEVSGRPIRQMRVDGPIRVPGLVVVSHPGAVDALVLRTVDRARADLAPRVSLRPLARPAHLALAFATCTGPRPAEVARVCARPLAAAAPLRFAADLPAAAPGQMVVITDGRVRHYALTH